MAKRVLILGLLLVVLMAACSTPAAEPAQDEQSATPQITVYRAPT